jgi:hypothetical protein
VVAGSKTNGIRKFLNAALIKKSPNFYEKYYRKKPPARSSSSWFLSKEKRRN